MIFPRTAVATLLWAAAPVLLAGGPPEAMKVTRLLTFEGVPAMGWSEFEYRLAAADNHWIRIDEGEATMANNGTHYLEGYVGMVSQTLEHADGQEFDLLELDLAEYLSSEAPGPVHFEGRKRDGTVLTLDVPLDGIADGDGPLEDFQKVVFPPEWTDLVKLVIPSSGWSIDNVKVRGFAVENVHESTGALPVPLQVVGILQQNVKNLFWRVGEFKGSKLIVREVNFSFGFTKVGLFDPATGQTSNLNQVSDEESGNPLTGEFTWYYGDGRLLLSTPGSGQKEVARVGQNGVDSIAFPAASNGKVIFANGGYKGANMPFTVFMASSTGVTPLLTPTTVLADGGTPLSSNDFTQAIRFTGNTFSIPLCTTKSGNCFLASFNGGPMRLCPGVGKKVPGTNITIHERGELLWLDDSSIGYLVRSRNLGNPRDHIITMLADGSSTASNWDTNGTGTIIPGSGFIQRGYGAAGLDRSRGTLFISGPLECRAVAPNNVDGIVARSTDGSSRVLVREGSMVPGFGELKGILPYVTSANGEFYLAAMNEAGSVAVLKGQVPQGIPQLMTRDFVSTGDGSVRFMVENLTLGQTYRVESSLNLLGPWVESSRFTAGSRSRSALGAFQRNSQGFFRVVAEE